MGMRSSKTYHNVVIVVACVSMPVYGAYSIYLKHPTSVDHVGVCRALRPQIWHAVTSNDIPSQ